MIPTLSFWITLIGRLAVEAALLVALAEALQRFAATPARRRAVWQATLLGVVAVWAIETGGWRRDWIRSWSRSETPEVTATHWVETKPLEVEVPVQFVAPSPETFVPSAPLPPSKATWWPAQIWAVGVVVFAFRMLGLRLWLGLTSLRRNRVTENGVLAVVARLEKRIGLRGVRVVEWPGLASPIAFGVLRPTVALPSGFTGRFEPGACEAILAHELAHLAARDPLWMALTDFVLIVAWWHPGIWWLRRQLRVASESAADEASALVPGGRVLLAELLVRLGRELVSPGWTRGMGVAGDGFKSQLARRVTALLKASQGWSAERASRLWITRAAAVGIAAVVGAIPWPGSEGPSVAELVATLIPKSVAAEPAPTGTKLVSRLTQVPAETKSASGVVFGPSQTAPSIGYSAGSPSGIQGLLLEKPLTFYSLGTLGVPLGSDSRLVGEDLSVTTFGRSYPTNLYNRVLRVSGAALKKRLAELQAGAASDSQTQLREYLSGRGIVFGATASEWSVPQWVHDQYVDPPIPDLCWSDSEQEVNRGRAIRFCVEDNLLFVRATFEEHAKVEAALLELKVPAPPAWKSRVRVDPKKGLVYSFAMMPEKPPITSRQELNAALDEIVLPKVDLIPEGVASALVKLQVIASKADPHRRPVPLALPSDDRMPPLETALIQERKSLRNVTLRAALNAVAEASTIPLVIWVGDHVVSLERRRSAERVARTVRINGPAFTRHLLGEHSRGETNAARAFERFSDELGFGDWKTMDRMGRDWGKSPRPSAIFTPGLEEITVIGTEEEVARFAAALDKIKLPPPTVWGTDAVHAKLHQIPVSVGGFPSMDLNHAVSELTRISRENDPNHRGVSFLINDVVQPAGLGRTLVREIDHSVGPNLWSLFEALVASAEAPIGYTVQSEGVFLRRSGLKQRTFRLNSAAFLERIRGMSPAGTNQVQTDVRAFCAANGLSVVAPKWPAQGVTAVFFNTRLGILYVQATSDDLDRLEKGIQALQLPPPTPPSVDAAITIQPAKEQNAPSDLLERIQKVDARLKELRTRYKDNHPKIQEAIAERVALVNGISAGPTNRKVKLEVKLVEVRETGRSGFGLDWVFGPTLTNQVAPSVGASLAPEDPRNENYHVDLFRTADEVATINGTQFAALLKRLENEDGNEVLSTPAVLTDNGRQSVVSVTEEVSMVDGVNAVPGSATNQAQIRYNTSKVPVGPSVEMLPVFVGDALRMHILAKITEFRGYDQPKPGQSVQTTDAKGKKIEGIQPLPHLRVRVAVADPVLRRGETAVLRGPLVTETVRVKDKVPVLGDVPLLGRLFRTESTSTYRKRLYVFVTPTEVDADGNPK